MAKIKLTPKQRAKIKRAVKALNDVREELASDNPDQYLHWFLEDINNLNLMEDDSHDEHLHPNQDAVIELFELDMASGGGW